MAVESASYINQLDPTNPNGSSLKSEGDNQIRLLKTVLQTTFPNVTGAVTPTQVEINRLVGVTGDIQTHIDRSLRQSGGAAISALPDAATRASKVLSFDASGNPAVPIAVVDLTNAVTAASNAATSATAAASSASSASTSATTATTQATAAASSATAAAGSASAASTSATNAAASATTATTQATTATTQATNAANSASAASTSATNAASSATAAAGSATSAGTSATNASNSATAAGTSATNAANSATAAATSATNAANSASAAAASAASIAGGPVTSVNSLTGVVVLAKGDLGLGNVDNTSDATKNSATATLTNKTLGSGTVFGAAVTGSDQLMTRVMFQDTGWVYHDNGDGGGSNITIDYVNGSVQRLQPGSGGSKTIAFNNTWPPNGRMGEILLEGVNLGATTITWPSTVYWIKSDGSVTQTFSSLGVTLQPSGTDWILFWTRDNGFTVFGKVIR